MREKKRPKVNDHISWTDFSDLFSQIYPVLLSLFLEYFWRASNTSNENIPKHLRAISFKNGQNTRCDLGNQNKGMKTCPIPPQIFCTGYLYAIPFFKKKFLENGFLEKKLFQNYNFYFLPKNHHFFLKISKNPDFSEKNSVSQEGFKKLVPHTMLKI